MNSKKKNFAKVNKMFENALFAPVIKQISSEVFSVELSGLDTTEMERLAKFIRNTLIKA